MSKQLLNYHDAVVRASDLALLDSPTAWLNDACINSRASSTGIIVGSGRRRARARARRRMQLCIDTVDGASSTTTVVMAVAVARRRGRT